MPHSIGCSNDIETKDDGRTTKVVQNTEECIYEGHEPHEWIRLVNGCKDASRDGGMVGSEVLRSQTPDFRDRATEGGGQISEVYATPTLTPSKGRFPEQECSGTAPAEDDVDRPAPRTRGSSRWLPQMQARSQRATPPARLSGLGPDVAVRLNARRPLA